MASKEEEKAELAAPAIMRGKKVNKENSISVMEVQ